MAKMLPIFRFGAGGVVGGGRQYWSWISLDDTAGAICHLLASESVSGPVNLVAPQPVTNAEFTKIVAAVLNRPALVPLPAFAARWALGEMAEGLLLASARVEPKRLLESGFEFRHPTLATALRSLLSG